MAENTNLKYEQINWGWLNDYAGYKFAPITFFDNLYTEEGKSFKKEYETVLDNLKTGKFLVGRAQALATPNPDNDSSSLIETNEVKPIYFKYGKPKECDKIEIDVTGNINIEGKQNFTINGNTINGNTINGNTINGNTINGDTINGTIVNSNINFTKPITLKFKGPEIEYSNVEITQSNSSFTVDLTFKESGVTAGSYGSKTDIRLSHEDSFTVPYITVDNKGRITAASNKTYSLPKGNQASVSKIPDDDTSNVRRYIMTNSATGNEATTNAFKYYESIYVDYNGDNASSAVLMGGAWNDFAEYRNQIDDIEPGYCVASTNEGKVYKTTEKFQACDGIVSDTYGFTIGKTDECKTPLAISGRVLAYFNGERSNYNSGDTVCAGPNGKICKMTREEIKEYPDRIIGIVSEIPEYEEWNGKKVNNRIWIKVK